MTNAIPRTNGFDATIVEEVQAAAVRSRLAQEDGTLKQRLVAELDRIADACEVADRWLKQGRLAEAVRYCLDAANLVKRGLEAEALLAALGRDAASSPWLRSLPPHRGLDHRVLERLNVAHVDLAANEELFAEHLESALGAAPPLDRLAALDRLRARQPRLAALAEEADALEEIVLRTLRIEADAAANRRDATALADIASSISGRGWGRKLPSELSEGIAKARASLEREASQREAQAVAAEVHLAFAAMDRAALERLEGRWKSLRSVAQEREASDAAFRWLEATRASEATDLEAARLVAELERVLDSGGDLTQARSLARNLDRLGRTSPARITSRLHALEARAEDDRRRRRRQRALIAAVVVIVVGGGSAWFAMRLLAERHALEQAERLGELVEQSEFAAAATLLQELDAANTAEDPLWPSARARYESIVSDASIAIGEHDAAEAAALELVAGIDAVLAETAGEGLAESSRGILERSLRQIDALDPDLGIPGRGERQRELRARITELDTRRAAAARAQLGEFGRRADAIATPDPGAGADQLEATRLAIASLAEEIRGVSESIAVSASEEAAAKAMLDRLAARENTLSMRLEGLADLERLQRELAAESLDESRYLAGYRRLLADHGAVLAARGVLTTYEAGLAAAEAGVAVRHWRETASRSIRAASEVGSFHPETRQEARAMNAAVGSHLSLFPGSPHADEARRFRSYLDRIDALPEGAAGERAMVTTGLLDSGFLDLLRVPLANGGFVYRRSGGRNAFDNAVSNRGELSVPAGRLLPRTGVESTPAGVAEETSASKLLREWLPRIESANAESVRVQLLGLIEATNRLREEDPRLQLAFLQVLWRLHDRLPGPNAGVAKRWLEDLDAGRIGGTGGDFLERAPEGRDSIADIRRLDRLAMSEAPDAERLAAADRDWWNDLAAGLAPLAASGTLVPAGPDGPLRRAEGGGTFVILVDRGGVAVMVPVVFDGDIASFAGAAPPPAPVQCFQR